MFRNIFVHKCLSRLNLLFEPLNENLGFFLFSFEDVKLSLKSCDEGLLCLVVPQKFIFLSEREIELLSYASCLSMVNTQFLLTLC